MCLSTSARWKFAVPSVRCDTCMYCILVTEVFKIRKWSLFVPPYSVVCYLWRIYFGIFWASFRTSIPKRCTNFFGAPHLSTVFHLIEIFRIISRTFLCGILTDSSLRHEILKDSFLKFFVCASFRSCIKWFVNYSLSGCRWRV